MRVLAVSLVVGVNGQAQQAGNNLPPSRFLGMNSCGSSGCHGGAASKRDECRIWSQRDFHSRAYATLTTARSARMAEVLGIAAPTKEASCTVCHAPFQSVPPQLQASPLDVTAGVSCESCHGPAESWLRGHTRPDWTHADRLSGGMRDLKSLYGRGNACVACHQNVPGNILEAGHPELFFGLDALGVSQPKHWQESPDWSGAQTWLVGQAIALREVSWELSRSPDGEKLKPQWDGLVWIMSKVPDTGLSPSLSAGEIQKWSDDYARKTSELKWSTERTRKTLESLAATGADLRAKDVAPPIQARRAERLVLGLDRLVNASGAKVKAALDHELDDLYARVQSLPDFDPLKFADSLDKFSSKLQASR